MKLRLCVLLVFVILVRNGSSLITKIECSTSDKNTCVDPFCSFTKNGTNYLANYGCRELSKPLDKINVHLKVYYKIFAQYYQLGYFPKFDYCTFIKSFDEKNFLYTGVKFLKEKLPESVRECPYMDAQMQVNNLTLTKQDFRLLPAGKYKVICTFSDDDDKKILKMITHVKI